MVALLLAGAAASQSGWLGWLGWPGWQVGAGGSGGWEAGGAASGGAAGAGSAAGGGSAAAGAVGEALAALDSLPEAGPAGQTPPYDRTEFLPGGWADLDGDGCYTRNEILRRDLADVVFEDGWCKVAAGSLADPYSGAEIAFDKAESTTSVQIDHVVPLAEAWRAGAWAWTEDQRRAFANDPAELLAVAGSANQSKGDSGPAEWLPQADRCGYAIAYATVAGSYRLAIPAADRSALRQVLGGCA